MYKTVALTVLFISLNAFIAVECRLRRPGGRQGQQNLNTVLDTTARSEPTTTQDTTARSEPTTTQDTTARSEPTTILDTTARSEPTTILDTTARSEATITTESTTMAQFTTMLESTTMPETSDLTESTTKAKPINMTESNNMPENTTIPEHTIIAEPAPMAQSTTMPETTNIRQPTTVPQPTIKTSSMTMFINNDTQIIINNTSCVCFCKYINQTLKESLEKRRRELTLNKTRLSSTVRRLTSAADHRVTSRVIGTVAIIILVVCGVVFFCADIYSAVSIALSILFKKGLLIKSSYLH